MKFTAAELRFLRTLNTPQKIQDFIDQLDVNFEPEGDTCLSPIRVLHERRAHCIEAATFAAFVLMLNGEDGILLDLTANRKDQDHVVTLFKRNGLWGAIAKSNHHGLGYRDPIYRTVRELVLSYFHEYLNVAGEKTLRSYSKPMRLHKFQHLMETEDVWPIAEALVQQPHVKLLTRAMERQLRKADNFTRELSNQERQRSPSGPQ
jgi:hypothetical protein